MNSLRSACVVLAAAAMAGTALAAPEYTTIRLEIDIAKPAKEVWAKVGGYCDISKWLNNVDCAITSGDGGVGDGSCARRWARDGGCWSLRRSSRTATRSRCAKGSSTISITGSWKCGP